MLIKIKNFIGFKKLAHKHESAKISHVGSYVTDMRTKIPPMRGTILRSFHTFSTELCVILDFT